MCENVLQPWMNLCLCLLLDLAFPFCQVTLWNAQRGQVLTRHDAIMVSSVPKDRADQTSCLDPHSFLYQSTTHYVASTQYAAACGSSASHLSILYDCSASRHILTPVLAQVVAVAAGIANAQRVANWRSVCKLVVSEEQSGVAKHFFPETGKGITHLHVNPSEAFLTSCMICA